MVSQRRAGAALGYANIVVKNVVNLLYTPMLLAFIGQTEQTSLAFTVQAKRTSLALIGQAGRTPCGSLLKPLFLQHLQLITPERARSAEKRLLGLAHLGVLALVLDQLQGAGKVCHLKEAVVLRVHYSKLDSSQACGEGRPQNPCYLFLTLVIVDNHVIEALEVSKVFADEQANFVRYAVGERIGAPELPFVNKESLDSDIAAACEGRYLTEQLFPCSSIHVFVCELSPNKRSGMNRMIVWQTTFFYASFQAIYLRGDRYSLIMENKAEKVVRRVGGKRPEVATFITKDGQLLQCGLLVLVKCGAVAGFSNRAKRDATTKLRPFAKDLLRVWVDPPQACPDSYIIAANWSCSGLYAETLSFLSAPLLPLLPARFCPHPQRVHYDELVAGKLMVEFVALILRNRMRQLLRE